MTPGGLWMDGWLLPRKLEQAADIGLSVDGADWGDVKIESEFEIRANPHSVSTAGLAFRARDSANAYMVELALDGKFQLIKREDGKDQTLSAKTLAAPLTDGMRYRLKVKAKGDLITTWLDDVMVDETRDGTFPAGRVGFYTPKEKWPLFDSIRGADRDGGVLLEDDFSGDLSRWAFARTLSFLSDGGKRDRLVWSGDLYFSQRVEYYAKADAIKAVLFKHLWDGEKGGFREAVETPRLGPEANALALSMGLLTQEQAAQVIPRIPLIKHGKFQGLASRGIFNYGCGQRGLKAIFDHNWLKLPDPGWQGATTTTECMQMITQGWGDESHPDTAIGYQFSSYLLGVEPLTLILIHKFDQSVGISSRR